MKLFRWVNGRQNTGYRILTFFKFWRVDGYLIHIPAHTPIPRHRDPVPRGLRHFRLNVDLLGRCAMELETGRPLFHWWRFTLFRPDLHTHHVPHAEKAVYLLSLGAAVKQRPGSVHKKAIGSTRW